MSGGSTGPALIINQGSGFLEAIISNGKIEPNKFRPIHFELARAGPRKHVTDSYSYEHGEDITQVLGNCLSRLLLNAAPITTAAKAPYFTLDVKWELDVPKGLISSKGYVQPYIPADRLDKGA